MKKADIILLIEHIFSLIKNIVWLNCTQLFAYEDLQTWKICYSEIVLFSNINYLDLSHF